MNAKWSVLTLFRDDIARQSAVKFCDALVQRFWREISFDFQWQDWPAFATNDFRRRGPSATHADIIIIGLGDQDFIDRPVCRSLEMALAERNEREGFLIGLRPAEIPHTPQSAATQQYLRRLAHECGLDYLTGLPQSLTQSVPESIEGCTLRATAMTNVLDGILHSIPPPPRLL